MNKCLVCKNYDVNRDECKLNYCFFQGFGSKDKEERTIEALNVFLETA